MKDLRGQIILAIGKSLSKTGGVSLTDIADSVLAVLREQEPVAWATYPPTGCVTQSPAEAARWEHKGWDVVPLYAAPTPPSVPDVDALAQFIREIDGTHSLGAGALAERIAAWLAAAPKPEDV